MKHTPFEEAANFDRLEEMLEQGLDPGEAGDLSGELEVLQLLQATNVAPDMPRSVEFRHGVMDQVRKRSRFQWHWVATAAAVFVLSLLVFKPEAAQEQRLIVDAEFLERADDNLQHQAMVKYLETTERLLVSMRDVEIVCSKESTDMGAEKELAQELLMQQKMLSEQIKGPRYIQARQLLAQLESILVDVNSLDACTDPLDLDLINEHISENRILGRLRVVTQNIRIS